MKTYIKGNMRRIIFNSDKGYMVGLFKIKETNDPLMEDYLNRTVTFTGYFHELNEDDTYLFYGQLTDHPRYGDQYQVSEYERVKPEDKDGVIAFLASDLFSGIGLAMATKIVDVLGEDALNEILKNRSCLMMVPKLSQKKANAIYDTLIRYEESHQTIVYLTELGFNMKDALIIYNHYRTDTISVVSSNIYQLLDDINELSFPSVDDIALKLGYEKDHPNRISACTIYVMNNLVYKNGDTFLELDEIQKSVYKYLGKTIDETDIDNMVLKEQIKVDDERYYLKELSDAEDYVVNKIVRLNNIKPAFKKHIDEYISEHEIANNIVYNSEQKKAIKSALVNNLLIITGGPGTGKTTIIKAITELYRLLHKIDGQKITDDVALLAPTGRASKRMSEATMLPAMTIHRYLKWNKDTNEFGVNENNLAPAKLVIVDEVSMIDINLLSSLFKGLRNDVQIVFVGDHNQLPSVGPGQVLKDLIDSDLIETVFLNHLYRQDENSYIPELALQIKDNNLADFSQTRSDYTFLKCQSEQIKDNLKKVCEQIVEKGYDYKRVQVMAPMYASFNGIDNLNKELQTVFNPKADYKNETVVGDITFREGDKILQLVNMPDDNVFNGDIGILKYIIKANESDSGKLEIHVDYDGSLVKYTPKDFIKIKHGFIISIHKSQGSEFEVVVIPVANSYKRMLYRKLIYTAITRAKKKLIIIGEPNAFVYAVSNNNEYIRKSGLKEKLINAYK